MKTGTSSSSKLESSKRMEDRLPNLDLFGSSQQPARPAVNGMGKHQVQNGSGQRSSGVGTETQRSEVPISHHSTHGRIGDRGGAVMTVQDNTGTMKAGSVEKTQYDMFDDVSQDTDTTQASTGTEPISSNVSAGLYIKTGVYKADDENGQEYPSSAIPSNIFEVLEQIEANGLLPPAKLFKLRSDMSCLAKALLASKSRPDLKMIPTDPIHLRPLLEAFHPARIRMQEKRWNNIKSELRKSLELTNCLPKRRRHALSGLWEDALAAITVEGQKAALGALGAYCTERYIEPPDVTSEVIEEYLAYRTQNSLRTGLSGLKSSIRQSWQRLCELNPNCGAIRLKTLPRYNRVALRNDEVPDSFHDDVKRYFARCRNPRPLDHKFRPRLSPETLRKRESYIYLGINYLLDQNWPADRFQRLADMLAPDAVRTILEEQFKRHSPDGNKWPPGAAPMASHLSRMAWQCEGLSDQELKIINDLASSTRRSKRGFPAKTRKRLSSFDDDKVLRDFFKLPSTWWDKSQKFLREGKKRRAEAWAKYSVGLAILLTKPVRISELASIDFEGDFQRNSKGKIGKLHIPGERTKTGIPIEAEFDPILASRIDEYFVIFIAGKQAKRGANLFPGNEKSHVAPHSFSTLIKQAVWNHLGIEVNSHLVRALIATIIFDEDPAAGPIAQQMLGHTNLETTISHYGMQRGRAAQRQYSRLIGDVLRRASK